MIATSVVIVSYNTKNLLENCVSSLEKTINKNNNMAVWVVDNNSSDGSAKMVRKKFPWVNLIANEENLGFATANNQAIRITKSKYVFLLNPDAEALSDSLDKMLSFMEKNKDVGILGPKLINTDESIQKEITPFPHVLDQILILLKLHRIRPFDRLVYPHYNYEKLQEVEHLMGAALLIRRKVFEDIGLFDEDFFLWFEETDLEKRAKEYGWKIIYYPKVAVKHFGGQSSKQVNPFKKQTMWNRSLWVYFKKHHPILNRFILIPFLLLSYLTSVLIYLRNKIQVA